MQLQEARQLRTELDALALCRAQKLPQRLIAGYDGCLALSDLRKVHLEPSDPIGPWRLHRTSRISAHHEECAGMSCIRYQSASCANYKPQEAACDMFFRA